MDGTALPSYRQFFDNRMNYFLRFPPDRLLTIYTEAQARLGLPAQSIEKDFWVCWTLREMVRLPQWGEQFTFKGGTSLSKAWKLIERFSEDLDLVIDREFLGFGGDMLGGKQQRRLKEECSRRIHEEIAPVLRVRIQELMPPGAQWTLEAASEAEDRDRQTLLFTYPSVFLVPSPNLRRVVKLEMGARSQTIPSAMASIHPYVADAIPETIADGSFPVRTVVARRTFWEKALLLHEETFRPRDPGEPMRKAGLARHYYDLWRLIKLGIADEAIADQGLFAQVVEHRKVFFRYNWMDYATMRPGWLRLLPPEDQLSAWRHDYAAMRANLFFGEAPSFEVLLNDVGEFARKFNANVPIK
jgi:hypothetical protein